MTPLEALLLRMGAGMNPIKDSVLVVATGNVDLNGLHTEDGIALQAGDRVACVGQTNATENGLYVASPGQWFRTEDANVSRFIRLGMKFRVRAGTNFAGSEWALASPTTGPVELGSTALTFSLIATAASSPLAPSGDPTGAKDQAAIAAAAAAGRALVLIPGAAYTIKDPSVFASAANGFQLIGSRDNPPTISVVAGWTGAGADSANNAMFRFEGAADGVLATTLSARIEANSESVPLASTAGLTSSSVLLLQGTNNGGTDAPDMSDGASIVLSELVEASGAPSGGSLPIKAPTYVHHISGKSARTYTPARNIRIVGVRFVGSAATVGVALRFKGVIGVTIEYCRFAGFSRVGIEFDEGCRGILVRGNVCEGGSNGLVLMTSCQDFVIAENETTQDGARVHASGIPKAAIKVKNRCTKGVIRDNVLRHRSIGITYWGGVDLLIDGNAVRDMYMPVAVRNRTTGSADEISGRCGFGIDSGAGPLAYAEFAQHVTISNNVLEDCWAELEQDRTSAFYVHDVLDVQIANIRVSFNGKRNALSKWPSGAVFSDCRGILNGLNIFGAQYAIVEENVYTSVIAENVLINGRTGDPAEALGGFILLDNGGGDGTSIKYSHLNTINRGAVTLWLFASIFNATPDYKKELHWWSNDNDGQWKHCVLAKLKAAEAAVASGELGELDSTSTSATERLCKGLSAGSTRTVIFATDITAGALGFVALPGDGLNSVKVVATVALGDLLKAGGTRQGVVDNAPANPFHIFGRAHQYRSTNGKILVGPVH